MDAVLDFFTGLAARYPELRLDLLARVALAAALGGAVGWEREHAHKPAGLRTHILICVGAALITDLGVTIARASGPPADPARLAAQIVSGIGFLGAGAIIQARGSVTGLTTAATMWVVAAIGIAAGFGRYVEAVGTTLLVLLVLTPLRALEARERTRRIAGGSRRGDEQETSPPDEGLE